METTTSHSFQAEVRQLLDIVINSLYTDKDIFVRELVSNAADSLEKLRHLQLTHTDPIYDADSAREISLETDKEAKTITITDTGLGMTREELITNLGTIAHSGSRSFLQTLTKEQAAAGNVIGRFGVGFYSVFMVAKSVQVYTHSWHPDAESLCWSSDGVSGYEITTAEEQKRGCRIVIHLKEDEDKFAESDTIKRLLERYSNFVSFPLKLNDEHVNTVEALWLKSKSDVTDEQYKSFYQFVAHAYDEPRYRLHFNSDAPISINSLLFVPQENQEQWGMGQMDPGVALYCRRVMIDPHPKGLLPDWLRFVKGVIDSDDLPLNISRETMQDSALIRKLNDVITKRLLKFLDSTALEDAEKYDEFYRKFSRFLKEGVATDYAHRDAIGKLLRFESSMTEKGKLTSFAEYVSRAKDGQEEIYYQIAPSREAVESGPYLEGFKARGLEVIYFHEPIDEYVCEAVREFSGKKLVAVDSANVKLEDVVNEAKVLDEVDTEALCKWLAEVGGDLVEEVRASKRLVDSPAAALTPDQAASAQMRAMMRAMNQDAPPAKVILEINPRHDLIHKLSAASKSQPETATLVARQMLDNALISAGLMEDPREMVQRMYALMGAALGK